MKNCSAWEGPRLEKVLKTVSHQEGAYTGAEEECEEEKVAKKALRTDCNPHSPSSCIGQGDETEQLSLRRERFEEGVCRFVLISHHPTLFNGQ